MKNIYKVASVLLAVILLFTGCSSASKTPSADASESADGAAEAATRIVTDVLGREVEIPTKINSIICNGPGTLRLVCYARGYDLVVGVEDVVNSYLSSIACPYGYAFHDYFKDLPSIGKGGARSNTAYEEEIITLQPDVILSSYSSDAIDELSRKTGIPVVCVTQCETGLFSKDVEDSLTLIGEIIGTQARCAELISYMEDAEKDLNARTKDIPDENKPRAYSGAITFGGGHGIGGTSANFGPFTAINAINVADETDEDGCFVVDMEKIVTWNPDVIFLDPNNMELVNEEYSKNPEYFNSLSAVRNGEVYSMPSYVMYCTNTELAIIDTYYAGMIMFPEQFADIDIEAKADEVLTMFDGKALYADMKETGLSYGKITIGE